MGKKKKTKTENTPWAPAQPYILDSMAAQQRFTNQQVGVAQQNAGILQSAIPGLAQKALGPNPALDAATKYNGEVVAGKYLGQGNPYLQSMVDKARNDATNTAGARFGALGGYGGTKYAEALGRGISDSELALRYGDYSKEREAMAQAVSQTPGLINAQYAGFAPLLALMQGQHEIGSAPLNDQARNLAGLIGNYGTQTTTQKGGGLGSILDRIGQAAALAASSGVSDRRLKTAIRRLGAFADGLGLYAWRYVWGGPEMIGVMADEVERIRPWALGPEIGGFKTVNYGRL